MEKNNDIHQVHETELSIWQVKNRLDSFIYNYRNMLSMKAMDAVYDIYKALDNTADQINKLEDKCKTKEDALKEMIKEVAELEREKIDLEVRLDQSDELRYRNAKYAWAIKTILKKATFSPGHVAEELRFMARKSTTPKDVQERWEEYADELLGEHSKLVVEIKRLEQRNKKLEKALNDKKFTTWEEVESEIFTPEEIAESKFRVEHMLCNTTKTHYIQLMADENKCLKKKNEQVKKENDNLKQTLLNILEKLETKVGLLRIHLLDSYEDRANLIMVEHDKLLIKYEKLKEENDELKSAEDRCKVYRNSYERTVNDVRKLQEFLEKCGVPVKYRNDGTWYWDFENSTWNDTLMKDCKLIDKCRELEKENNNLTTDNKRLSNAVEAWRKENKKT